MSDEQKAPTTRTDQARRNFSPLAEGSGSAVKRHWKVFLPLGFVILSLALLVLIPVVVGRRISAVQAEIQNVAAPARQLASQLQIARASEFVSLIGFQVTENQRFIERFQETVAMEERVLERLEPLARALGSDVVHQWADVRAAQQRWHTSLVGAGFFERGAPRSARLQRIYERYPLYQATAMAATALADAVQRAVEARRAEIVEVQQLIQLLTIFLSLLAFAATLVVAWIGRRLQASNAERRRRASEEASFRNVAEALTAAISVREVMEVIADSAVELTRAFGAYVERIAPSRPASTVEVVAVAGSGVPPRGTRVQYPGSLTEEVLQHDEPELVTEMGTIGEHMAPDLAKSCPGCSGLLVPLKSEEEVLGTLVLLRGPHQEHFEPDKIARARVLGDLAAVALRGVLLLESARRHATEAYRRAAELDAVIESIPDTVLILTDEGINRANESALEQFGFESIEDARGDFAELLERIQPRSVETGEATAPEDAVFARALRGERAVREVIVRNLKTGEDRIVRAAAAPIRQRGGNAGAVVVASDITERVRAETALQRQSARVTLIQNIAIAANEATGVEAAVQTALDEVCNFTGWPVGHAYFKSNDRKVELRPSTLWHVDTPEDFEAFRRGTEATCFPPGIGLPGRVLERKQPAWGTDVHQDPNFARAGAALEVGIRVAFGFPVLIGDEVVAVLEFYSEERRARDESLLEVMANIGTQLGRVVERWRAEEEREKLLAREHEAHFAAERRAREETALREAAGAVAASFTVEKVIRQIAKRAVDATGADGAFVQRIDLARNEVEIVATAGDRVPAVGARMTYQGSLTELAVERGEPQIIPDISAPERSLPNDLLRSCGACSAVEVPLRASGQDIGALFLLRETDMPAFRPDEIERAMTFGDLAALAFHKVQLLEESERKRKELQRVMESRNRLMRGFSHDVKNPLSAVDGRLQLLEDHIMGALTEKQGESVKRARESLQSALGLIEDLVELARVEAGRIELKCQPTDVGEVAVEMAEEYRPQAETKGLTLNIDIPHKPPLVQSDPARIRQILGNLISNAAKYTDKGSVAVSVEPGKKEGAPAPSRWIAAEVRDTGPGIPEEKREELFQEFTRISPEEKHGTGLGLAISQRLAHALGGQITVASQYGKGSTFTLWLPVDEALRSGESRRDAAA